MSETIGVLSILEGALLDEARRLWALFEREYQSKGVQSFDYPNVTFQGGRCHNVAQVQDALSRLSRQLRPFEVMVDGWSCFEPSNVVFLKVVLTDDLKHINQVVNDMLQRYCDELFDNYLPRRWPPHITVAMADLTEDNLKRARRDLRDYYPRCWQLISNLHLVRLRRETGRIEIVQSCTLWRC